MFDPCSSVAGLHSIVFRRLIVRAGICCHLVELGAARFDLGDLGLLLRRQCIDVLWLRSRGLFLGASDGGIDTHLYGVFRVEIGIDGYGCDCRCNRLGRKRGLLFLRQTIGFLLFVAFDAQQTKLVPFACQIGRLCFAFALPDLALGETVILDQRYLAGADVSAGTAFDAIEQAVFLRLAEVLGFGEPEQFLRLQLGRANIGAACAADAGQSGRRWREQRR